MTECLKSRAHVYALPRLGAKGDVRGRLRLAEERLVGAEGHIDPAVQRLPGALRPEALWQKLKIPLDELPRALLCNLRFLLLRQATGRRSPLDSVVPFLLFPAWRQAQEDQAQDEQWREGG